MKSPSLLPRHKRDPEIQKKLIFDAIEQLHHVGLNAHVIIFDGCADMVPNLTQNRMYFACLTSTYDLSIEDVLW